MTSTEHDPTCEWKRGGKPCRRFSTDGTVLGAEIAHTMGTTDEGAIVLDTYGHPAFMSDVAAEQADWDSEILEVPPWASNTPVLRRRVRSRRGQAGDMHEPPPYPSTSLEWPDQGLQDPGAM